MIVVAIESRVVVGRRRLSRQLCSGPRSPGGSGWMPARTLGHPEDVPGELGIGTGRVEQRVRVTRPRPDRADGRCRPKDRMAGERVLGGRSDVSDSEEEERLETFEVAMRRGVSWVVGEGG